MKINLQKELVNICNHNKDGSYSTQYHRKKVLSKVAEDLKKLGFYNLKASGLKPKHVEALVKFWQGEGKSTGTIKNRMAHLRWWSEKVNKKGVIVQNNAHYGIDKRVYVTNVSKATVTTDEQIQLIKNDYVRCSVELQRAFGLRREECIKFQPLFAIREKEQVIVLKASWTKGGKERTIPIRTEYQRKVLDRVKITVGSGSLIPKEFTYRKQLNKYTGIVAYAGMSKLHGLRHKYAQDRYKELTGRECPAAGGIKSKELTQELKEQDLKIRLIISKELGHEREQITAVYLGR